MKKFQKLLTSLLIAVILIGSLFSTASPVTAKAAAVKLNKKTAVMAVGQTLSLKLKKARGKIIWKSSDQKVAAVTGKGKVSAKRRGTATITAKNKKKTYQCRITVKPYTGLTKKCFRVETGRTLLLNQTADWVSSDSSIARVSKNGFIQAIRPGMCEITATVKYHRYIYIIKVPASAAENTSVPLPTSTVINTPAQSLTDIPSVSPVPTFITNAPRPTQTITGTPWPTQIITNTPRPTQIVTSTPRPTQIITSTPRPTQIITNTPAPAPSYVWLSATGEKYHKISNCGRMNPAKATRVTLSEAIRRGYPPCDKCF